MIDVNQNANPKRFTHISEYARGVIIIKTGNKCN